MEDVMSKQCEFCGKKPQTGNYVSHSNIKTKRVFNPNLQNVRHQFANGEVRTVSVCTRCLRSGVVTKPVVRKALLCAGVNCACGCAPTASPVFGG